MSKSKNQRRSAKSRALQFERLRSRQLMAADIFFSNNDKIFVLADNGDDFVDNRTSIHSQIEGGNGNDELWGGEAVDHIIADYGHDLGNDLVYGRGGDDVLLGGRGHDILMGLEGDPKGV